MSPQSEKFRFEQNRKFLLVRANSLPFPLSPMMSHRVHPSRLPFGAPVRRGLDGARPRCTEALS
jgi:hypothetical protein